MPRLYHRENVAGRIFEPGDQRAVATHDAFVVGIESWITLETYAFLGERLDRLVDILDRKIQYGKRCRRVIRFWVQHYVAAARDVDTQHTGFVPLGHVQAECLSI